MVVFPDVDLECFRYASQYGRTAILTTLAVLALVTNPRALAFAPDKGYEEFTNGSETLNSKDPDCMSYDQRF
jgi:hypothetical protein